MRLVIPTIPRDVTVLLKYCDCFTQFLPITEIVVIGSNELKSVVSEKSLFFFLDENELIDYERVRSLIVARSSEELCARRTGWYLQQFIKMAYARVCEDEYYLLWDSDTVPVHSIRLFDETGRPYLDYKTEYCAAYFDTMSRLLPGYTKVFGGSFIAEHMLVKTQHMRDLLNSIEANEGIEGETFYEKIINSIRIEDISKSGFSEFETYGTFIYKNYKEHYILRRWSSLRQGSFFYSCDKPLNSDDYKWLAKRFDAISFEKDNKRSVWGFLITSRWYCRLFNPTSLIVLSFFIRGSRRLKRTLRSVMNRNKYS